MKMRRIITIALCIAAIPLMVFAESCKIEFTQGSRYVGTPTKNVIQGRVTTRAEQYVCLYNANGKLTDYMKSDLFGKFSFNTGKLKKGNNYFYVKSLAGGNAEVSPTYKVNVNYAPYYRVRFISSGGTGKMSVQKINRGLTRRLLANRFKKKDYVFKGWALKKGGPVKYADKAKVKNLQKANKTINLYAVWEPAMGEKIAKTAETYAWPLGTPPSKYSYHGGGRQYRNLNTLSWSKYRFARDGACCCHWAGAVCRKATGKYIGFLLPDYNSPSTAKAKLKEATSSCKTTVFAWDGKQSSLKRGDILTFNRNGPSGHVMVYLGNGKIADASSDSKYGHVGYFSGSNASLSSKRWYFVVRFN